MKVRPRGFTLIELLIVVAIIAILAAIAVPNFLEAQTRSKVSRVKADERTYATAIESYAVDHGRYPPTLVRQGNDDRWQDVAQGGSIPFIQLRAIEEWLLPLSTPVAYVTDALLSEPFNGRQGAILYEGWDIIANGGNAPPDKAARDTIYLYFGFPSDALFDQIYRPLLRVAIATYGSALPPCINTNNADQIISEAQSKRWFVVSPGPDTFFSFDRCLASGECTDLLAAIIRQITDAMVECSVAAYDPSNGTISQGEIVRTALNFLGEKK